MITREVGREVIRELVEKMPKVVPNQGEGWRAHYAFYARNGFTEPARSEALLQQAQLLTLAEMEPGLRPVALL